MATTEKHSSTEHFLQDLKALASHLSDGAGALKAGCGVYIDWHVDRRLGGSDAEFGDAERGRMESKLEKAHTHLRNAQRLSDGPPGWLSIHGMQIVNDLLESHLYPVVEEAMRLHAEALERAAIDLSMYADADASAAYTDG